MLMISGNFMAAFSFGGAGWHYDKTYIVRLLLLLKRVINRFLLVGTEVLPSSFSEKRMVSL